MSVEGYRHDGNYEMLSIGEVSKDPNKIPISIGGKRLDLKIGETYVIPDPIYHYFVPPTEEEIKEKLDKWTYHKLPIEPKLKASWAKSNQKRSEMYKKFAEMEKIGLLSGTKPIDEDEEVEHDDS